MKRLLLVLFIIVLSISVVSCKKNEEDNAEETVVEPEEISNVIARVNDEEISIEEFNKYYAMQSYDFEKEYGAGVWDIEKDGKSMKEIRQDQTIDYLIRVSLIKKYVTVNGFKVDDAIIDEAYNKYMDSKSDDSDIKAYFSSNGIDEAFLKNFLVDQLYLRVYQEQIVDGIYNSEESLASLFDGKFIRYKTSHILVDHNDRAKLEEIREKLLSEEEPADFSLMARENSIHSTSAVRGGNLGYVIIGNMPEAYEEVALTQELYEVSEIIETEYGYHLIFVEDRQTITDMMELGMPEEEIDSYKDEIISKFASLEFVRVFDELKKSSNIEIHKEVLEQE